ncbi:hypothetical protein CC79DRAFT_1209755 [Sarocladium strictum]
MAVTMTLWPTEDTPRPPSRAPPGWRLRNQHPPQRQPPPTSSPGRPTQEPHLNMPPPRNRPQGPDNQEQRRKGQPPGAGSGLYESKAGEAPGNSIPNSHSSPSSHEKTSPGEEVIKRQKQLDIITEPALIRIIRDMTEDSFITREQASSLVKRLRSLRKGAVADLIKEIEAELAEGAEHVSVSHDSGIGGIGDSNLSEGSTRIDDDSDAGTGSTSGSDRSGRSGSSGEVRLRMRSSSWRRVSRRKIGARKHTKRNTARSGAWEDYSDSGGP